jgi:hypothetical protein
MGVASKAKDTAKKVKKGARGLPGLTAAATTETLLREGPKGLKSDAGTLAGFELARRAANPAIKRLGAWALKRIIPALAVTDVAETAYEAGKAVRASRDKKKRDRDAKERYGTMERAKESRERMNKVRAIQAARREAYGKDPVHRALTDMQEQEMVRHIDAGRDPFEENAKLIRSWKGGDGTPNPGPPVRTKGRRKQVKSAVGIDLPSGKAVKRDR